MAAITEQAPANRLRSNSLGVGAITFMVISAAAPLTAVAGGTPLGMLMGNGAGFAGTYLIVTLLLLLFAVGYVTMARYVGNAGAFYSYAARGLGGLAGGAAALVAILSYNAMQIGVMGLLGAATSGLFAGWGIDLPWWVWSFAAIAAVAVLGYRQVDLSAKILTVLVLAEYAVVIILDLAILGTGGDGGLSMAPFSWSQITGGAPAIAILFCFAAFIGFEATTIYAEEARDPKVTVPRATYLSVLLIGVFYTATAWLMAVGAGVDKLLPTLQGLQDPTTFLFGLSDRYAGTLLSQAMGILFVSSLYAGVLAFHNAVARYIYVAGREKLLPETLGVTHAVHQSPHMGSVVQTVLAALVVGLFAVLGLDPVLALFSWLTNVGTLGVITLMAAASLAVVMFFRANPDTGESAFKTTLLPGLAFVAFAIVICLIVVNFGNLSGASGFLGVFLPSLVLIAAVVGFLLAGSLRGRNPAAFARLGQPMKG
ncbi:amino acid permease [Mesorhizobium sp. L-8-10]|uniref:APC family permease n=1 Tax=Mesorhizobium sp. L-8-10 TaxID=2744523 RepID=UPI0019281329|nr:APC family permease [Mesorhizobium sp. L-8-10]BCH28518.1 amino acid permease [Mesorhizobium sp. L-8-10]